jgi:hypothetical protein
LNWVDLNRTTPAAPPFDPTKRGVVADVTGDATGPKELGFIICRSFLLCPRLQTHEIANPIPGIATRIVSVDNREIQTTPKLRCDLQFVDVVVLDSPEGHDIGSGTSIWTGGLTVMVEAPNRAQGNTRVLYCGTASGNCMEAWIPAGSYKSVVEEFLDWHDAM